MKNQYIECGKIVTTHGLTGEVKVQPWCDYPEFLTEFQQFYTKDGDVLKVKSARIHKDMGLIVFEGYSTIEEAQTLRNTVLYIDRNDDNLEEGDYYVQDLIGLKVYNADSGNYYGTLVDVSETGANDVYHIRFENGKEQLIPAIPQVVIQVDIDGERMDIRPLEGLFDE